MTEPKIPMYISVQLENGCGNDVKRVWLPLPATKKQYKAAKEKIHRHCCATVINQYSVKVPGISQSMLMDAPLSKVNHLAKRLATLDKDQIIKLCAICDSEMDFYNVEQFIAYTYNTKKYTLVPEIMNEEDLGRYDLDKYALSKSGKFLKNFVDPHKFGFYIARLEKGEFTSLGYITKEHGWHGEKPYPVPDILDLKGDFGEELYGEFDIEINEGGE